VTKEVVHLHEVGDTQFDDELNSRIETYESDGWELVDTELSSYYDHGLDKSYSVALLTFEK
jgi:hypothetical protein